MYGGLFETQSSQLTHLSTAPDAYLPSSDRRCYSKQHLIYIRSTLQHSHAFNEQQRSKLGPVSCSKAEQRWTSRIGADGLFSCRETKGSALKYSQTSSPPPGIDERSFRRDAHSQEVSNSHYDSSTPPESSPRSSFERDSTSRTFHSSPDGSSMMRRSPSPPPKRFDLSARLSIKTEGNGIPIPTNADSKFGGNMAASPREEKFFGEHRRRSPSPLASPRAHPVSSPRAPPPPSSYPPGFGPQPTQRNNGNKASRSAASAARDAYYKSRICRGPNMSENFASRIAYRQGKSSSAGAGVAPDAAEDPSSGLERHKPVVDSIPTSRIDGNQQSPGDYEGSSRRHVLDRPTLEYTISSDISFEDFSKRLAAEATNNPFTESNDDTITFPNVDHVPSSVSDAKNFSEKVSGEEYLATEMSHQEDVDELQKWFGRISAGTEVENVSERSLLPQPNAESPSETKMTGVKDNAEPLDSDVLSFFDTIRSQALLERNQMSTENGEMAGSGDEKPDTVDDAPRYAYKGSAIVTRRPVRSLESEESKSSEVERFFQLFTEGKPVYSRSESAFDENHSVSSKHANPEMASSPLKSKVEASDIESDSGGLKRLWAELAAANQFE